jgi:hypothetical protein
MTRLGDLVGGVIRKFRKSGRSLFGDARNLAHPFGGADAVA